MVNLSNFKQYFKWCSPKVSKTYTIFNYQIISPYVGELNPTKDVNYKRLPEDVFKDQVFELFRQNFIPLKVEDYLNNYESLGPGNYYCITFTGNYVSNSSALDLLEQLGIPHIVFMYFSSEKAQSKNPIIEGLPLTGYSTMQNKEKESKFLKLGDLPIHGEDLLSEPIIENFLKAIRHRSDYFNYLNNPNPALYNLIKNQEFKFGFSEYEDYISGELNTLSRSEHSYNLIDYSYDLPRVNSSRYLPLESFKELLKKIKNHQTIKD